MSKDAKRRFHDLEVNEVSLVGSPANETPFYVIKNKQKNGETNMVATASKQGGSETILLSDSAPNGADEVISKCMASVASIVGKVAEVAKGAAKPEATPESAEVTDPTEAALIKAGVSAEVAKATAAVFAKANLTLTPGDVKKSAEEATPAVDPSEAFAQTVLKAARLTPSRIAQLSQAADLIKLALEGVEQGTSPATKPPKGTVPGSGIGSQIAKGEETELSKMIQGLTEAITKGFDAVGTNVKALNERVESIEKAKPAGDSEGSGTTDSKTPVQKSIFSGVV